MRLRSSSNPPAPQGFKVTHSSETLAVAPFFDTIAFPSWNVHCEADTSEPASSSEQKRCRIEGMVMVGRVELVVAAHLSKVKLGFIEVGGLGGLHTHGTNGERTA